MVSCVHVYIHIYTHTLSFTCIYFSTVIGSVSYPQFYTLIFFLIQQNILEMTFYQFIEYTKSV